MADFNKDEANKALEIAIENTKNGKYEEALKSANEARLMNPELTDIKRLVTLLQVLSANPDVTHYEILGVQETANENEICLAFRKLAVNLNPDTNKFPKASEAFRRIYEAMEVLSDDRLKYDSDLAVARKARAQVAEFRRIFEAMEVAEWKSSVWTFDGMISSSEHQAAFLKEKAGFEGAEFDAALWNDVIVAPEWTACFDVFDTFDGMISSSELKAAFEVYDKEPQSTPHHPSFQKRFVCSSNEVAGRGTKRSNTAQSTLTHPVPKKKMDGQGPLFFK